MTISLFREREKHSPSRLRSSLIATCAIGLGACSTLNAPVITDTNATPLTTKAVDTTPSVLPKRGPEDEIIYFVLPDRFDNADTSNDTGGIAGDRLQHGFDPTHKGFYNGGDLQGLIKQLDYLQGLGITAIWLTPIFENKAVQGTPGNESSGYHGYWITDFLNVDPHIGTREDFKQLVDEAHGRDMRVYMDIITNHSADVIQYEECHGENAIDELKQANECPYRTLGDYPYTTSGDINGKPTNTGFLGDDAAHLNEDNFSKLTDPNYAYNAYVPEAEKNVKNPAWMNDTIYYHNRGHTTFKGEDSLYGDFAGLDDFMTEHPRVVEGFKDVYAQWIRDFKVDGYRIDTARHVRPEFWQELIPHLEAVAKEEGIEHFHIFGEVYEPNPGQLAVFTRRDELPTVLDFAFQNSAAEFVINGSTGEEMASMFFVDSLYGKAAAEGRRLPTFLGNHDMGRFAGMLNIAHPDMTDEEKLKRTKLAHAIMMYSRGVPTIYYGDEQGFVSDGNDQDARENMFASTVDVYNDNDLLGTDATTAERNFDTRHPLYVTIAKLAQQRLSHTALRKGEQTTRLAHTDKSILAISRTLEDAEYDYVAVFNAENEPQTVTFAIDGRTNDWESIEGICPTKSSSVGTFKIEMPALGYALCRSKISK